MAISAARSRRPLPATGAVLLLAASLLVAVALPAAAATFTVTRPDDPEPGECGAEDCSLREAVIAANTQAGPDTLVLPVGTFELTIAGDDNTAAAGDLDVTDTLTIRGAGFEQTFLDGQNMGAGHRILHVPPGIEAGLTVTGVTMIGGPGSAAQPIVGGVVLLEGELGDVQIGPKWRFDAVTITGGDARLGGGGIAVLTEQPGEITHTALRGNSAPDFVGGAIFVRHDDADVTITTTIIEDNTAGGGGGIALERGTVTISESAIISNTGSAGGGLYVTDVDEGGATADLRNVTFVDNAGARGAAIRAESGGVIDLQHVAVVGSAVTGAGGALDAAFGATTTITAANTAVGDTTGGPNCHEDAPAVIFDRGGSISDDDTCTSFGRTDDIRLGALADNGGPTPTQLPGAGSPLIDSGVDVHCTATDARGFDRNDGACDAGPVEVQPGEGGGTVNTRPTVSDIPQQNLLENGSTGQIGFTIGDAETPAADLVVTATASNTTLLPPGSIVLGGSGADRTITVTPAAGEVGSGSVRVTVQDAEGGTASDSFTVIVMVAQSDDDDPPPDDDPDDPDQLPDQGGDDPDSGEQGASPPPEEGGPGGPVADVFVTVTTSEVFAVRDRFVVDVVVGNRGPDTASQVEVFFDVLRTEPLDLLVVHGDCIWGHVPQQHLRASGQCFFGDMAPNTSSEFQIEVSVQTTAALAVEAMGRQKNGEKFLPDNSDAATFEVFVPDHRGIALRNQFHALREVGFPLDLDSMDSRLQHQDATAPAAPLVLEVTAHNDGPDPAEDVGLRIDLDPTLAVSVVSPEGSCAPRGDGLDCTLPDLAAGAETTILVGLQPTALGPVRASARIVSVAGELIEPEDVAEAAAAGNAVPVFESGSVVRVAGPDRIATAIAASQQAFDAGRAGAVVLVRADAFADALAGAPLAAGLGAPLLLTHLTAAPPQVIDEIARVLPDGGPVVLLGGPAAIDPAVDAQLAALGYVVTRLAGADRYATAVAVADAIDPDRVLVADGTGFADALAAAAVAAATGGAVVFTDGSVVPAETAAFFYDNPYTDVVAVGGPAAAALPNESSVVGATRYDTAAQLAAASFSEPVVAGLASGEDFPDALVAAAQLGRFGGPLLLSASDDLPDVVGTYLDDHAVGAVLLFGGPSALSSAVEAAVTGR